jgi:mono/diheme cytochrome c family protein
VRDELLAEVQSSWTETVAEKAKDVVDFWNEANNVENLIVPQSKRVVADAESIARGRALYLSKENKCSDCHGPAGRGDGPQTEQFSAIDGASPARNYDEPGLRDAWGNVIMPRNLTRGVYRFGRRPLDIYRRVHQGINGTPMPGFGKTLKDEQIWDIVNYVLSIPHQDGTTPVAEEVVGGETVPETASR